ncbi:MAG: VanZ family protein [Candidatus Omnitrophica bacterium]|nr:VanZ family protein [Candidatus Omnitrophota bacterium]
MSGRISKNQGLSALTVGLGLYIIISAAFMLAVRNWLFKVFGDFWVNFSFKASFVFLTSGVMTYAFRIRLGIFRGCLALCIFVLAFLFSMWQPYFSEKTHVLNYGLLGYLSAKDLVTRKTNPALKSVSLSLLFISLISASDEIFQGFLPYRVAELRDFITNIISGFFGASLLFAMNKKAIFERSA